ncbi:MAG: hypothetical protein JKY37_34810 [Nannocystaceae bacterium]|nr:hypothetical protein [Nannocystaceae bacterium]
MNIGTSHTSAVSVHKTLLGLVGTLLVIGSVVAGCNDDDGAGADDGDGAVSCDVFEFEYEGEEENGVCPRLECCPGNADGTFSAFANGRCLSDANCDAVCEDPDAAFECL